jgi:hypothetical protein
MSYLLICIWQILGKVEKAKAPYDSTLVRVPLPLKPLVKSLIFAWRNQLGTILDTNGDSLETRWRARSPQLTNDLPVNKLKLPVEPINKLKSEAERIGRCNRKIP